ncbi:sarcosine oxidase subunit gamma [Tianweitania sediminis]|jgi:sarcosine oxidase subunit gamma|uniref:Sarcosine oxidase subunit gamma n=1 Tax=Tianweitania sediminis TaxID=1502156 RepID=A0A8J7UHV9_9HYPH|nr:sarcosine oxidase subunit gamma [Tianweitania sediminis]MBP0438228.1 sarcosine oxidase subunit gamma [Tianweitania sediminis]HEV7415748.1 sarcosine oxidase subunit gamma [Tianweitania sediminis]
MAEAATTAARRGMLDHRSDVINGVSLVPAAPAYRMSLRARPDDLVALGERLGLALPTRPKTSASAGERHALWLGPDEWLVLDLGGRDPMQDLAGLQVLHSAVDVSHRNTAVLVTGEKAADVINAGCPQDLSLQAFPVGACSRTVLGKIEIVLLRTGEDAFRVECWRSFAEYAFSYLADAARGV